MADHDVLVVVDQPNNIGALSVAVARSLGCQVAFLPSKTMRRCAEMLGKTTKTDKIDAVVIAEVARTMPKLLRAIPAPDKDSTRLKALRSLDQDLARDATKAICRLRAALLEDMPTFEAALCGNKISCGFTLALLREFGGPWAVKSRHRAFENFCEAYTAKIPDGIVSDIKCAVMASTLRPEISLTLEKVNIPYLARELERIKAKRDELGAQISRLLKKDEGFNLLKTIPGIGDKIASGILAEIDIDNFDSADALASYAGVAPKNFDSGTSVRQTHASKDGNRKLKGALFLAARCSAQHCTTSALYLKRKRDQGKSYAAAHIALARKLIKVIFRVLKDKSPYRKPECSYLS
jgi:transposase